MKRPPSIRRLLVRRTAIAAVGFAGLMLLAFDYLTFRSEKLNAQVELDRIVEVYAKSLVVDLEAGDYWRVQNALKLGKESGVFEWARVSGSQTQDVLVRVPYLPPEKESELRAAAALVSEYRISRPSDQSEFYSFSLGLSSESLSSRRQRNWATLGVILMSLLAIIFLLLRGVVGRMLADFDLLNQGIARLEIGGEGLINHALPASAEAAESLELLRASKEKLEAQALKLESVARTEATSKLAKVVAHDLRSPVAAIQVVLKSKMHRTEDGEAMLVQALNRVLSIARSLLTRSEESQSGSALNWSTAQHLSALIEEKRIEWRQRSSAQISFGIGGKGSSLRPIRMPMVELTRVISNLVNNSLEAIGDRDGGLVNVSLNPHDDVAKILISDNGPGLPDEVVSAFGVKEISVGKDGESGSGFGLGIFSAAAMMRKWNGSIAISETGPTGTKLEISVPWVGPGVDPDNKGVSE